MDGYHLQRFIEAQKNDYSIALQEIMNGKKRSHWMWYIFPQIDGLGHSEVSKYYSIKNLHEAMAYIKHPVLGKRLHEISDASLRLKTNNATEIFGSPDDMKLRSCMTLFASLPGAEPVFDTVLKKFFAGIKDERTLKIIHKM